MARVADIDAYCARIGFAGPREPTLDTLRALHLAHSVAIPFENLDARLGRAVPVELAAIERKLVGERRGGWCFEHNLLFRAVLQGLGFEVAGLAARVLWGRPEASLPPRSHMLLRVVAEGVAYVADVGFGGQTLSAPLKLETGTAQATPHGPFRLLDVGSGIDLQSRIGADWRTLYRFDLAEQLPQDYVYASYWLSTHPASPFRTGLMAARNDTDRRYALADDRLSIHVTGGASEHRTLTAPEALREVLEDVFRIRLPADPELGAVLAATVARDRAPA